MTFTKWLMKARLRDGPTRDLRDDIKRDEGWPSEVMSYGDAKAYLTRQGACGEAIDALRTAWRSFSARHKGTRLLGTSPKTSQSTVSNERHG
jgi:hypothetical protein